MSLQSSRVVNDDKRLIADDDVFWIDRVSVREWHLCRLCYHDVPCFLFYVGYYGSLRPTQVLLCCWECGGGIEIVHEDLDELAGVMVGGDTQ